MRNGKVFIIDTSFWNDDKKILTLPNFKKAKVEQGVDAVLHRIGQGLKADGSLFVDIDYVQNYILARDAGLFNGSYYFLDHNQGNYKAGQAQSWGAKQGKAVHQFMITSGLIGEIPPACDSEENVRWGRLTRERIEKDVIPMTSAYLETLAGLFKNNELFVYINRYFESLAKGLTKWQLWLAVLSGEGYDGNKDLDNFPIATIEQWGSYMNGKLFGFDNGAVDTNRWNKTPAYFNEMMRRWNPRSPLLNPEITPEDETPTPITIYPDLPVQSFSQKDSKWGSKILGFSSFTIAEQGCVDTILAANCRLLGKDTDPARLNQALKDKKGYEGANVIWGSITDVFSDIEVDWNNFERDAALVTEARIDAVLASSRLVMVQTDYNPVTSSLEPHWVAIIGKGLNGYRMMDPIDGAILDFNKRYKKMLRMAALIGNGTPVMFTDAEKLSKLWNAHPELHQK